MASTAFMGTPVQLEGTLPDIGAHAPDFHLVKGDLTEVSLKDFAGKKVILNIFPSLDTPVCAESIRKFNQAFESRADAVVLCVSRDLPFAQERFKGAEGLKNVLIVSDFRSREFGKAYGVEIVNGPLVGLLARAVIAVDGEGRVIYSQLVDEISHEPDYDGALKAIG